MAHPFARRRPSRGAAKFLRTVLLERTRSRESFGFSIRGGKDLGLGVYVSQVDLDTLADKGGLEVGDQLVEVNSINFEWISHESAVMVIKTFDRLEMVLRSTGRIPELRSGMAFTWVDPLGRQISEDRPRLSAADRDEEETDFQLPSSMAERKVLIHKNGDRMLGLRIRGGKQYNLGIYIISVDRGSLAEEHGLHPGDQILMVNSCSFQNVLHEEAVAILKNSSHLIMTIKSGGKIPTLTKSYQEKGKAHLVSKHRTNLDMHHAKSTVIRTESLRSTRSAPDQSRPWQEFTDSPGASKASDHTRERSHSFRHRPRPGSAGSSIMEDVVHASKKHHKGGVSPLAMTELKATRQHSPAQRTSIDLESGGDSDSSSDSGGVPKAKFQYGVGTQVMLKSFIQTPPRELLHDRARRLLEEDEVEELKKRLDKYESGGKVRELCLYLINTLTSPTKLELLKEVRSVLRPMDLARFDKQMSPFEIAALKRFSDDDGSTRRLSFTRSDAAEQYSMVLTAIQSHGGPRQLRRVKEEHNFPTSSVRPKSELGMFKNPRVQQIADKASTHRRESHPVQTPAQSRDSFLAWNEDYNPPRSFHQSHLSSTPKATAALSKPVVVEVRKTAPTLGIGLKMKNKTLQIAEVLSEGAAFEDGFLGPGFTLLKINGQKLHGVSVATAEQMLTTAYNNDEPSVELIVIPPSRYF